MRRRTGTKYRREDLAYIVTCQFAIRQYWTVSTRRNQKNPDRLACPDKAETVMSQALLSENWGPGGRISLFLASPPFFVVIVNKMSKPIRGKSLNQL